ncbi:type I restriction endonuclease [Arthrobacter sp. UM1]|uniref:type I restriction endonuclease n=1 Tax=Arthrobacter sp. UM1 TaxID=2766776 RepID=UPI0021F64932|nr:type I restriction endonuclease [Arthrobacter sp. UM1]
MTDRLSAMAKKVEQTKSQILTEEATKTSIVMPFIQQVLGYNVFDIGEVVPEFITDVGIKKGEKIDYAILHEGEVSILIECKKVGQPLSLESASQLFRYFHVTNARIAILTNGQHWHFYTDLDSKNKMDSKPFMELDLLAIDPVLVPQVAKVAKESFDLDSVLMAAEELKYVSAVKKVMSTQMADMDADFASLFIGRIYGGRITAKVREQMTPIIQTGLKQFVADQVNERLTRALGSDAPAPSTHESSPAEPTRTGEIKKPEAPEKEEQSPGDGFETTQDEVQAHLIIRAIVGDLVAIDRVTIRDAKTYCAVILDDNNRLPLARLWFNRSQRYVGTFDESKTETRNPIQHLEEIYALAEPIRESLKRYLDR